jgi:hypothetical protein
MRTSLARLGLQHLRQHGAAPLLLLLPGLLLLLSGLWAHLSPTRALRAQPRSRGRQLHGSSARSGTLRCSIAACMHACTSKGDMHASCGPVPGLTCPPYRDMSSCTRFWRRASSSASSACSVRPAHSVPQLVLFLYSFGSQKSIFVLL